MLTARTLLDDEGVTLADVACRHQPGRGNAIELRTTHALVFVRRGCFVRAVHGDERLLDPTVAYATTPGLEERIDHPLQGGDDCTYLALVPELVAALSGGDPALPARPLPTSPAALRPPPRRAARGVRRRGASGPAGRPGQGAPRGGDQTPPGPRGRAAEAPGRRRRGVGAPGGGAGPPRPRRRGARAAARGPRPVA